MPQRPNFTIEQYRTIVIGIKGVFRVIELPIRDVQVHRIGHSLALLADIAKLQLEAVPDAYSGQQRALIRFWL